MKIRLTNLIALLHHNQAQFFVTQKLHDDIKLLSTLSHSVSEVSTATKFPGQRSQSDFANKTHQFTVLQPLGWRCVECAIHHERHVREE